MGNYRGTRACLCGCGKWVEYWEWRDDEKYWVDCIPGHKRKECVRKIPVYYSPHTFINVLGNYLVEMSVRYVD